MSHPLVSIIVPNYNHATYLEQRLDSVFNQTFTDYEVILLDDASTDASIKLLGSYRSHPKVTHVVINERNSGSPFLQWQKGIELAKGKYIWIAESDDWADGLLLEKLVETLEKDGNIQLVYCASYRTESDGEVIGQHQWASVLDDKKWTIDYINNGQREIEQYLQFRNTIPNASAVVFRRSAVLTARDYISFRYSGDWALWLHIVNQGKIAYVAEPLNYFRRGEQSLTLQRTDITKEEKKLKEYIQNIRNAQHLIQQKSAFQKKHLWMLNEWLRRYDLFKNNIRYYFPDLPFSLSLWFYFLLAKKILR
ncbi:MAG: glycosyltransferase [Bacteroidota bacterium]